MTGGRRRVRDDADAGRVTNVELFFDLVFVFAVTQLSHLLVDHLTGDGVFHVAILLALVWQVWVYTTWSVNFLDPSTVPVRAMLLVLMLGSLVLAAELPYAFGGRGLVIGLTYAAMQIGRALFSLVLLRGALQANFVRILAWSTASGAVAVVGGLASGHARELLWLVAIAIDVVGAAVGFRVPGLGRSQTRDWTVLGGHFAERCQAFVLIALGESIVVIGTKLTEHPSGPEIVGFGGAFAASVAFWWIYFDRAADDSARRIEESEDPGRLARSAFHWIHPLLIAGIIAAAAADEIVLAAPTDRGRAATAWLTFGGTALYLAGHAIFKGVIWRRVSWPRVAGAAVALALVPLGSHVSVLTTGLCALAVTVGVALGDRLLARAG